MEVKMDASQARKMADENHHKVMERFFNQVQSFAGVGNTEMIFYDDINTADIQMVVNMGYSIQKTKTPMESKSCFLVTW